MLIMQSVPSPSLMLILGASFLTLLAQSGFPGSMVFDEHMSPIGTLYVHGVSSQVPY